MVKFLSTFAALSLPIAFGQNSTSMDSVKAIAYAGAVVNSDNWAADNSAAYVQLQRSWVSQAEEKFNQHGFLPESIVKGLEELANGEKNRVNDLHCEDGNCVVPFGLDRIWNYGCWCNFGEHLMQGHGPPVNTFDAICKDFSRCLKCARFDGKKENFGCDPVVQTYQTGAGPDFVTKCSAGNPDDQCAVYVCSCESTIIAEIMDLAFQPHTPENEYSDEFLHSNGFEYDSMCPVAAVTFDEGNDCCGVYPKRFPYALGNPSKTCCKDSSLYNPMHQECCEDGTSADIGSCL